MGDCSTPDELGTGFNVEGFLLDELRGMSHDWCCQKHYNMRPEQILEAYRFQVLQKATEKIRVHADSDGLDYYSPQGLWEAADLIDPEVEK